MATASEATPLRRYVPLKPDHFLVGATLGVGSFSRVRLVTHKVSNTTWALKTLKKAEIFRLKQVDHVLNERQINAKIRHQSIVNLVGTFQDTQCLYMVFDFVPGGELYRHLREAQRLPSTAAIFYASQVVLFLEYMHRQDIVYRDLKPENLLLDERGYLKVADFGFAKKIAFKSYTLCGTSEYMAPEVILGQGHGKGVDWWALGVLCYEMLVGQPPWVDGASGGGGGGGNGEGEGGHGPMGVYQQILEGKVLFPKWVDAGAKDLCKKLLTKDLTRRFGCLKAGAGDIKGHAWFTSLAWTALQERELSAPLVPACGGDPHEPGGFAADTSNFDPYPDEFEEGGEGEKGEASMEDLIALMPNGRDPFVEF